MRADFARSGSDLSSEISRGGKAGLLSLDSELFADLSVKVTAILGQGSLSVRSMLDLADGSVVDLETPLDGLIDITVNGKVMAQGEIVAVGDKFGVRIKNVLVETK